MDIIITVLLVFGLVWGFVAYIKSLVNAAKNGKWAWFVLMLLFWPLFFIYLFAAYEEIEENSH